MQWIMAMIYTGLWVASDVVFAKDRYGEFLCLHSDFYCIEVQRGDSWTSLFPNDLQRDIVRRVNRMNLILRPKDRLAIPHELEKKTVLDLAPVPHSISPLGEKLVKINLAKLAWAAYDESGQLIWWGPVSPGQNYCNSTKDCRLTPLGWFRVKYKKSSDCLSHSFPIYSDGTQGGAVMPFCMFFYKGYSLHGTYELPGYPSSHGCVQMFIEDAKWLNEQFVQDAKTHHQGTLIVIDEF